MKNKEVPKIKGYISSKKEDLFTEAFKSEVSDNPVRWPKELGVEHPFRFEDTEKVFKRFGLLNGMVNKIVDNIVGDFSVKCEDDNTQKLVEDYIKNNNFRVLLRDWIKEAFVKGNGFLEVDHKEKTCKVVNANTMYVKRNKYGEPTNYTQWAGTVDAFIKAKKEPITFTPDQIVHLPINKVGDEAYGLGALYPNERVIENLIINCADWTKLVSRKAGAPIHVKVGQPGEAVNPLDIDNFKVALQYMNNRTEWVTDANVEMKVIDFGAIGERLQEKIKSDLLELCAGMDIPEVLMNSGQLNEGIAKTQIEGWNRRIMAYQDQIEELLINHVFKPYLKKSEGIYDAELDFIWNLPSEEQINAKLIQLNTLMSNAFVSENMKRMIQLEIARLLNFDDAYLYLQEPEVGLDDVNSDLNMQKKEAEVAQIGAESTPEANKKPVDKEKEKDKGRRQPEVPGVKQMSEEYRKAFSEMTIREFIDLHEIKGFTYSDYLLSILKRIKTDKFEDLKGITESDIEKGMLTEDQIKKLKTILREGFRKNQAMQTIEDNIREGIQLKDRITEDGKVIPALTRPETISRTEVVRLSNEGLLDLFKENNIEKKQWIAASSDRTCEVCNKMDGQVVKITESFKSDIGDVSTPPVHPNCRCSIISA
jgi:SPP1 gp7 family putative phage head morphogenesis protein